MKTSEQEQVRRGSGIPFGIISAVAFGTSPFFARNLYDAGFNVDSVLFFRFLPAVFILGAAVLFRGTGFRLSRKECGECLVAGLLFCVTSLLLFLSYQKMDIGIAATLLFLYPVFVGLFSALFFRERLKKEAGYSLFLAFAGVALLSISTVKANISLSGILFSGSSAVCYAGYQLWIARSGTGKIPALKVAFYVILTCTVFYFIRVQCGQHVRWSFPFSTLVNIAGVSMIGGILALGASAVSLQRCGATVTSILGALEPFTAVLLGILVFHEIFTMQKIFGILLIVAAVLCIIVKQKKC